jgi:hypothetical protein
MVTHSRLSFLTGIEGCRRIKTARKHVTLALTGGAVGNHRRHLTLVVISTAAFKASRFRMTCDLKTAFSPTRPDSLLDLADTHRATNQ